mmetsp:Transcript_5332/g.24006  ORF Transcript_5332/g.24006 Transcript_5332/m.24006 type:complete len:232 (+) Transcript_5332:1103-1798(+)
MRRSMPTCAPPAWKHSVSDSPSGDQPPCETRGLCLSESESGWDRTMEKALSQTNDLDSASRGASNRPAHAPFSSAHALHSVVSHAAAWVGFPKPAAAAAPRTAARNAVLEAPTLPSAVSCVAASVPTTPACFSPSAPSSSPSVSRDTPHTRNSSANFAFNAGSAAPSSPAPEPPSGDSNASALCVRNKSTKNARSLAAVAVATRAAEKAASAHDSARVKAASAAASSRPMD